MIRASDLDRKLPVGRCTSRDEYGNANIKGVDMTFMLGLDYEEMALVIQALNRLADFEDAEEAEQTENSSEKPNNCETCKHYKLTCELFSEVCKYEPTTQTETQNSNLTFEKRTMRDCYNCKKYETEDECIECNYEPKDEPQTENPCDGCVCDDGKHLMYCMNCKGIAWKTEPPKVEDEPQTERNNDE